MAHSRYSISCSCSFYVKPREKIGSHGGKIVTKKMDTLPSGLASQSLAIAVSRYQVPGLRGRCQEVLESSKMSLHGVLVESHRILPESKPSAQAGQELVAIITSNSCDTR